MARENPHRRLAATGRRAHRLARRQSPRFVREVKRTIPNAGLIHIRNMETATLAGAVVMPPVPAFYHQPKSIDDLLAQTAGKILDQFTIGHTLFRRWDGTSPAPDDDRAALRA
jgi:3-polyprenyl-4-hydroxybenzoate decarboxylase